YGKSNTTVLGEDGVTREVVKLDEDDNVKKELDEEGDDNREEWEYRPPPRKVLGPVMPGRERVKEELEEEDPRDAKARRKAEKKLAKKIKKDERRAEKKRRKEQRER
ncbi:hydroxyproline-rich glycoprotein precursor, putative, partial [Perkinsus marinus ATCC 50983]